MTIIDGKCLILDALGGYLDLWQLTDLREHGVIGCDGLSLHGHDLQLGIEGGEEGGHEIVEAIEDTEGNDQGHRGYSDTYDGDGTDDIDGIGGFLREEIPTGYEKRENGKFTFLLFQEFVYALDIIQRVVDKETQLGDDAQLVTHART